MKNLTKNGQDFVKNKGVIKIIIQIITFVHIFVILFTSTIVAEKINVSAEIKNLKSKNINKKLTAIERLAKSKDKKGIFELRKELTVQKNNFVKSRIVESFSYFQDEDVAKELVNIVKTETNPDVKFAAVYSLAYNKTDTAVDVLIETFLNDDELLGVRLQAAATLTNYSPTENIYQCFLKGLKDKMPEVRAQAIVCLSIGFGPSRQDDVVKVLKEALEDKSEIVKKTAKERLEFLGIKVE